MSETMEAPADVANGDGPTSTLTEEHHDWASAFTGIDTRGSGNGGSPGGAAPDSNAPPADPNASTAANPNAQPADPGAGSPATNPSPQTTQAIAPETAISASVGTGDVITIPEITVEGDQGAGAEFEHGRQDALAGRKKAKIFAPQYQDSYNDGYALGVKQHQDDEEQTKNMPSVRPLTEEDQKNAEEFKEKQKEFDENLHDLFHTHPPHTETEEGPPKIDFPPGFGRPVVD